MAFLAKERNEQSPEMGEMKPRPASLRNREQRAG